jgi:hypothetical protein
MDQRSVSGFRAWRLYAPIGMVAQGHLGKDALARNFPGIGDDTPACTAPASGVPDMMIGIPFGTETSVVQNVQTDIDP